MLACFICFTMRALMLADLVEAQADGEESGHFARGWKRWVGLVDLLACHLALAIVLRAWSEHPAASNANTHACSSRIERRKYVRVIRAYQ